MIKKRMFLIIFCTFLIIFFNDFLHREQNTTLFLMDMDKGCLLVIQVLMLANNKIKLIYKNTLLASKESVFNYLKLYI